MNHPPGLFVAIEGPSGAGKTTLVGALQVELAGRGYKTLATKEPTGSAIGELARKEVDTYRGRSLACLVAADRYHHLQQTIEPALAAGRIVLCDRYVASSLALQVLDGVDEEFVRQLNSAAPNPDLYIFVTVEPEVAYARSQRRDRRDRFHASLETAQAEARRYADVARQLAESGCDAILLETEWQSPPQAAARLSDEIQARIKRRSVLGNPPFDAAQSTR
jgi:dTMP kinase